MKCHQVQSLLKPFLDGKLSGDESFGVRSHLASCRDCASKLKSTEWIEILPALDEMIEPSEDFNARFYEKLEARQRQPDYSKRPDRSVWSRLMAWGWPWRLAAVGTLATLIVAGIYFGKSPSEALDRSAVYYDIGVTENLPLLQEMTLINNLDLLENLDAIESMPSLDKKSLPN
jgi:anti-sigma factor RsiW